MAINPAMGMGYSMGGDDYYTQMLYQQMMQNGGGYNTSWANPANGANDGTGNGGNSNGGSTDDTTQKSGGFSVVKPLVGAGIGAGAAYSAMRYTNNPFNSALEAGKTAFNEDFMKAFSSEYAAMMQGNQVENFFKGLGTKKVPITAENFNSAMDSIEEFIKSGDVNDLTKEAKQMLQKKFGLADLKKATIETLHTGQLDALKGFYTETAFRLGDLQIAHNLNAKKALMAQLEGLKDAWKDLGKGAESAAGKVEFLRENARALGISEADYKTLLAEHTDDSALNDMWKKYAEGNKLKTRKKTLEGEVKQIQKAMQKFASKYDTKAGFFAQTGFKKIGSKKQLTALESALKSMKSAKAGKYAGIAAVAGAIISFFA